MILKHIAVIHTPFKEKFGTPRQSGLIKEAAGVIEFDPKIAPKDALRGIEQYSHLWILWEFSDNKEVAYSPTVRPPRLGGNEKIGVFATRSPYRPNPIGLSLVQLDKVKEESGKYLLLVSGVDMVDGTPIVDIKPYIPYADKPASVRGGFAEEKKENYIILRNAEILDGYFTKEQKSLVIKVIESDPRPSYQDCPDRIYGVFLFGKNVRFFIDGNFAEIAEILP